MGVAEFSSAELAGMAAQLRAFADGLDRYAEQVGTATMSVSTDVGAVRSGLWAGPRAEQTLGAIDEYVGLVRPAVSACTGAAATLRNAASTAEQIAGWMVTYESTLSDASWYRFAGLDVPVDLAAEVGPAQRRLDALQDDWRLAAIRTAGTVGQWNTALADVGRATVSGFPTVVLSGDAYLQMMLGYSFQHGVALADIDASGRLQALVDDRLWFLLHTPVGRMYYDVIETLADDDGLSDTNGHASFDDIELATTDPELVAQRVEEWADMHGIELTPDTVAFLAGQVVLTAGAMRVTTDEPWNSDEIRSSMSVDVNDAVLAMVLPQPANVAVGVLVIADIADVSHAWYQQASPSDIATVTVEQPRIVGNLNGLPAAVRDPANRLQLEADIAELETKEEAGTLTPLEEEALENARKVRDNLDDIEAEEDPESLLPMQAQLYAYEPYAFDGDGRAAVVTGDLDTADHVAVTVPGMFSSVDGMAHGRAWNLYQEATWAADGSVAVVDWMGYDAPDYDGSNDMIGADGELDADELDLATEEEDLAGVTNQDKARAGAALLAADVEGINVMRGTDDPHLTVVGNSYGSTTSAIAADQFGLEADDLVLSGSPGAGKAGSAADFTTGTEHTWVATGSSDPVTFLGHNDGGARLYGALGDDPSMEEFGANRMQAESVGRTRNNPFDVTNEHGSYYDPNSESLYNISAVVAGEPDLVVPADPRHQEPFVETHSPVEVRRGRFGLPVIEFHSPVEVNPWPDDPEWGRDPTQRTHNPEGIPE